MRTSEEWRRDYLRLSEVYGKFKNSDMAMGVFFEQIGEIFKESQRNNIYYRNLIAYRSGLKKFCPAHVVRETVRHEGMHAQIAKKIVQDMGITVQLEVVYTAIPQLLSTRQ